MRYLLILSIGIASCGFYPMKKTETRTMYVRRISPGENGLCIYGIKPNGMKGKLRLVDSNNKYQLGDKFVLRVVTSQ